jgi:uncharacterized protein (TIGR00730 family)
VQITVFGGSEPRPGDEAYAEAYRLGRLIGLRGHTVLTGGYIGTMEAVSCGAAEAGGHVIGVTCEQIEAWRPVGPNAWVQEELRFTTLRERLYALIDQCDAALALPGGIGTLAEVAAMWSQLQTGGILLKPLILIGPGWKAVMEQFSAVFSGYVKDANHELLAFAPDVETAYRMLDEG